MLYLVSIFDKMSGEFVPVGIFDDKKKIKKIFDGYNYSVVDYRLNTPDYALINDLEER